MTTTYDVLHGLLKDAHRYEMLAQRAERALALTPSVGANKQLAVLLREIAQLSQDQSFEAKRLLSEQSLRVQ